MRHPVLVWTAVGAVLFAGAACAGPLPSHGNPAWIGWTLAVLAVQPVYPWIAHRWGTPALHPPTAWAPAVFLARLLGSLQLTVAPLLMSVALFFGAVAAIAAVLACLVAGSIGTYLLREQRWSGLVWKAVSLLPAGILAAYGPSWATVAGRLLLALGVLTSLATWTALRAERTRTATAAHPTR